MLYGHVLHSPFCNGRLYIGTLAYSKDNKNLPGTEIHHLEIISCLIDSLHPSQQFFCYVGVNQY